MHFIKNIEGFILSTITYFIILPILFINQLVGSHCLYFIKQ